MFVLVPCSGRMVAGLVFPMLAKEGARGRAVREALEAQKAAVEAAKSRIREDIRHHSR